MGAVVLDSLTKMLDMLDTDAAVDPASGRVELVVLLLGGPGVILDMPDP